MEFVGYIASISIGVALGIIGGGGSILTVPVLVYLFNIEAVTATSYSLFIVGATSAVGSIQYFRKNLVNVKTAIVFGIPSIITVFLTRAYIIPAIPVEICCIGSLVITKSILLMLLFATLMIVASFTMIKESKKMIETTGEQKFNFPFILIEGIFVGLLTGLVGAGGGFLIIPALVILSKLPMKEAIGTSLVIIAAKSLIGFLGEGGQALPPNWRLLLTVTSFAILGIFIGTALSKKIDGARLKKAFGYFILLMGLYIVLKELFFNS
jgi:uncharacterized protein